MPLYKKHFHRLFTFPRWNIFQLEVTKEGGEKKKKCINFFFKKKEKKSTTDLLWIPPRISYFSSEVRIPLFRFQKQT